MLEYHLLYRWFLGVDMLEPGFDANTFAKNRQRLLRHEVAQRFFDGVVLQADRLGLLSDEHFTVDGTLIEAAASLKRFRPRTVGADKSDDTRACVVAMRKRKVTPHVAQNTNGRRSAIDGRTTSWPS